MQNTHSVDVFNLYRIFFTNHVRIIARRFRSIKMILFAHKANKMWQSVRISAQRTHSNIHSSICKWFCFEFAKPICRAAVLFWLNCVQLFFLSVPQLSIYTLRNTHRIAAWWWTILDCLARRSQHWRTPKTSSRLGTFGSGACGLGEPRIAMWHLMSPLVK